MDKKEDLQTEEIWLGIESAESEMTPKLRAEEVGVMMVLDKLQRIKCSIEPYF